MATALNPVQNHPLSRLKALEIKALWRRTFKQSPAFLLTGFFVFLEYVRPAAAYSFLDILPWSQITIILATLACVFEGKNALSRNPLGWGLIGLFTAVIVASSVTAVYPEVSRGGWELWISWLLVMFIITSASDNEERLLLMLIGFLLWNLKMSQHSVRSWASAGFSFRSWGVAGAPGWFSNSGEFAIEMCVFLPMAVYLLFGLRPQLSRGKQIFLAIVAASAVIGIVASSSRGAILGAVAVALYIVAVSPQRLTGLAYMSVLALVGWVLLPPEQLARFETAGEDGTSVNRLTYWGHAIQITNQYPLLGIGYDNWIPYYRSRFLENGALPHNIFLEASAELGYLGLSVFLVLIGYTFYENFRTRRVTRARGPAPNRFLYYTAFGLDGALVGYLVSGFFVTVLFYPYFWVNLAFTIALSNVARQQLVAARPSLPMRATTRLRRPHLGRWRPAVAPAGMHRH